MKITRFLSVFFFSILVLASQNASAEQAPAPQKTRVVYFYSVDCPKCQIVKPFLDQVKKDYGDKIDFLDHDVKEKEECRQLFYHFVQKYNVPEKDAGTPIVFVGDKYFAGPSEIEKNLRSKIDEASGSGQDLLFDCHDFLEKWPNVDKIDFFSSGGGEVCGIDAEFCPILANENQKKVSLTMIITTAAIDSINPCAIAVLIFLITILISLKSSRKRMVIVGLFYIGAVFATYYLAGLGIMRIITQFNIAKEIGFIAGMIVLFAGFLEIKEALHPDGKQLLRIPASTKPIFTKFLKEGTIPSVIVAGILVSAFELPCTGQVYLAILSMLSGGELQAQGYLYLFIYNLIFVLPLIIILLIAAWGFDIKRMDNMRRGSRMTTKIIIGIIMVMLGLFLLFQDKFYAILGI